MTQKYLAFEWYSVNHKLLTKTIFYLKELSIQNYLAILLPFIVLYDIWPVVFWVSKTLNHVIFLRQSRIHIEFSSVTQSCPTLCDPMNRSMPGLPVHHQLLEFTQTHVHRVGDAIQPSHPLSSPSPPARGSKIISEMTIWWKIYYSGFLVHIYFKQKEDR